MAVAVIAAVLVLVGGHHEVVYRWRQRRRARNLFIDLTQKRERWH